MAENLSETRQQPTVQQQVAPIIRDVAIVWILTFFGGFVAGFALAGLPGTAQRLASAAAVSNLLFGTVGFTIAGYLAPPGRWRHLGFVVVGCWLAALTNVIFFHFSIHQWIVSVIFLIPMAGLGGVISTVLRKGA